jgi:hypothetical protein
MWLTPICKLTIDQITPLVKGLLGIAFAFAGRYYASLWSRNLSGQPYRCDSRPIVFPIFSEWLLLDSRVVDVPMAYNATFVLLSSLKLLFFNSPENKP